MYARSRSHVQPWEAVIAAQVQLWPRLALHRQEQLSPGQQSSRCRTLWRLGTPRNRPPARNSSCPTLANAARVVMSSSPCSAHALWPFTTAAPLCRGVRGGIPFGGAARGLSPGGGGGWRWPRCAFGMHAWARRTSSMSQGGRSTASGRARCSARNVSYLQPGNTPHQDSAHAMLCW